MPAAADGTVGADRFGHYVGCCIVSCRKYRKEPFVNTSRLITYVQRNLVACTPNHFWHVRGNDSHEFSLYFTSTYFAANNVGRNIETQ